MAYNISDAMRERVKQAVRNFNKVIDKTSQMYQTGGKAPIIPTKRSTTDILKSTSSYAELRRELRSMNRITKGKATDIVNFQGKDMTIWQRDQIKYDIKAANRKRAEIRELTGYQSLVDTENLRERKPIDLSDLSSKQINEYIEALHEETTSSGQEARLQLMMDNYKQSIRENFTEYEAKQIISRVNELSPLEFAQATFANRIKDNDFSYSSTQRKAKYNAIKTALDAEIKNARKNRNRR